MFKQKHLAAFWPNIDWVQDIAKNSSDTYGSRRRKKALNVLNLLGYPVSRGKARKLMREAKVQVQVGISAKVTGHFGDRDPPIGGCLVSPHEIAVCHRHFLKYATLIHSIAASPRASGGLSIADRSGTR
ncbi:MAG: transposase [Chromatiales bacterium]|nr:transposase [Chromatiales bacterium]